MAHPSFTEVAYCSDHGKTSCELTRVLYNAISRLQHALDLATFSTLWQSLQALAEIAKGTVFLFPLAFITLYCGIGRQLNDWSTYPFASYLLLTKFLLLCLFSLTSFLFGHRDPVSQSSPD